MRQKRGQNSMVKEGKKDRNSCVNYFFLDAQRYLSHCNYSDEKFWQEVQFIARAQFK